MKRTQTLMVLGLAAAAIGGCGGGDDNKGSSTGGGTPTSDDAQIRALIALGNRHDPKVCDRVTGNWLKTVTGGSKADCRKQVKAAKTSKVKVTAITVQGDKGNVDAKLGSRSGNVLVVRQSGTWKLDGVQVQSAAKPRKKSQPKQTPGGPRVAKGDKGRIQKTYLRFFLAVRRENEKTFCSLLTDRYAGKLVGKSGGNVKAACVKRYRSFNFKKLKAAVSTFRPVSTTVSGSSGRVQLSDGEKVLFKKQGGTWLIDNVVRHK